MRRRRDSRLSRWWRERRSSRAASDPKVQRRQPLVLICLLLALALWAVLVIRPLTDPNLRPGRPSPVDIRSPRTITYVSDSLTEQERIRKESSPDAVVYTSDPNIPIIQRTQLAELLQTIGQIRDDPSLDPDARHRKLISLPLPNSTLVISPALAIQLTRLTPAGWATVRDQSLALYDRAMSAHDYEIGDQELADLRDRSMPYWSSLVARGDEQKLILLFGRAFLKPNRLLDEAATQQRKQALRDSVDPVLVTVQENENVVHVGDIVTPAIQEKLEALGLLQTDIDWFEIAGKAVLAALLAFVFGAYVYKMQRNVWRTTRPLLVVVAMIVLTALAARMTLSLGPEWVYAFPLGVVGLILATLFPRGLALMAVTIVSVLAAFQSDGQVGPAMTLLIASMAGILTIGRGERWLHFLAASLVITAVVGLMQLAFWLTSPGGLLPDRGLTILIATAINGVATAVFSLGLYNLVGHLADVVTPQRLMELAHPTHPLLRKLIREAPGTYYHSVSVGNLAESAGEAIGADALLLRVASYYHDIGKTIRPYFFTDNQSDRENVHNDLDPHTSAEIICDHVIEGEKMAVAARLPRQIVEFIRAHHGTSLIKHFYQLAVQQEDSVNEDDFRYPGPKPQTREQAIMMLADSVEATVRSKAQGGKIISAREEAANGNGRAQSGQQTLEELVNSIIDERIRSGQLDECSLTLSDIAQIRQVFINTLQGIYHPRVDYAPQVVKHS
jgi:putative nucleotidyltransferase with HDIG domain